MLPMRIVDVLPDNGEDQRVLFGMLPERVQAIIGEGLANRTCPLSEDDSLAVLTECIDIGVGRAEKAMGKTAVVVVGNTGAGKSTFVNYILKCILEKVCLRSDGEEKEVYMVSEKSPVKEVMSIGHSKTSHSFVPELAEAHDMDSILVDCPGFLDNRGAEISIANAANIKAVMAQANGVTLVAVLNYYSLKADRGRGVRELLDTLLSLFGSVELAIIHAKSILLVISHAPVSIDGARIELNNVRREFSTNELSPNMTSLLNALLDRACIFHPENRGGESWLTAGPLSERIHACPPISDPAEVFKIVLSIADEATLRKLVEALFRRVKTALDSNDYEASARALSDMKRLEIVDHVAVTRFLESAKKRVSQELINRILEAQTCVVLDKVENATALVDEFRTILKPFSAEPAAKDMLALDELTSRADFVSAAIVSRKEELVRLEQQSQESKEFASTLEALKRDLAVAEAYRVDSLERENALKSELAQFKSKAAEETANIQAEDKAQLEALEEKLRSASAEERMKFEASKAEIEAKLEGELRERQDMEVKQAALLNRLLEEQEKNRREREETERNMRAAIAKAESEKEAAEAKATEKDRIAKELRAKAERDRLAAEETKKVEEARHQAIMNQLEEEQRAREAEEARKAEDDRLVEKVKREAEAKAKQEEDQKANQEEVANAKREAEAKAKQEAEQKANEEEVAKAKREADVKAKQEAEAKAKQDAEANAKWEAEEKASREIEAKAKREAEENAKQEAEENANRKAEAKAKRLAEEKATREADATAYQLAKEKANHAADEIAKQERAVRWRLEGHRIYPYLHLCVTIP